MHYVIFLIFCMAICVVICVDCKIQADEIKRHIIDTERELIEELNNLSQIDICRKCTPNDKDMSECWFVFDSQPCKNYRKRKIKKY